MKYHLIIAAISFLLVSCKKETNSKFEPYFKLTANGKNKTLGSCGFWSGGGGEFSCDIIGDSVLFITVGCDTKLGFYVKGNILNGTYQLDDKNRAWYDENYLRRYNTTINQKGTLTIEKGSFQPAGVLKTLKGNFLFNALDTSTGQTINITNGEFLIQRREY